LERYGIKPYSFVVTPVFFLVLVVPFTQLRFVAIGVNIVPLSVNFSCAKSVIEQKIGLK
jgi:hypothetical protein